MKILSVGWFNKESNTSLHRHLSIKKNVAEVDAIDASINKTASLKFKIAYHLFQKGFPIPLPDEANLNEKIKIAVSKQQYDIVWIDKGVTVNKSTLIFIKNKLPKCKIVSFSPDNMAVRHNQSQNYLNCIPFYDITFTTKSYILEDLKKLGVKNIHFMHKTYGEDFHYPRELSNIEKEKFGADLGFIGAWEKERCESILFLVDNGIHVKVFGDGKWNEYKNYAKNLSVKPGVFSDDYPKALSAFKISLCFLRKINFDQQTARTMEIPACGGFLMAERTNEHLELFEDKKEAVFFSNNEQLLKLCNYYLKHEEERIQIAKAGLKRCKASGYSNEKSMKKMLNIVLQHEY
jgi:hypothetical protein